MGQCLCRPFPGPAFAATVAAMDPTPNPGSDMAILLGCTCPVIDNGHGLAGGEAAARDRGGWYITEGCPVHSPRPSPTD